MGEKFTEREEEEDRRQKYKRKMGWRETREETQLD